MIGIAMALPLMAYLLCGWHYHIVYQALCPLSYTPDLLSFWQRCYWSPVTEEGTEAQWGR